MLRPELVEQHNTQAALRQQKIEESFRWVMRQPQGRTFVHYLLHDLAGIHRFVFTGNSRDALYAGARKLGLDLLTVLKQDDDELFQLYQQMESEGRLEALAANHGDDDGRDSDDDA
jgi:hypothetical protein